MFARFQPSLYVIYQCASLHMALRLLAQVGALHNRRLQYGMGLLLATKNRRFCLLFTVLLKRQKRFSYPLSTLSDRAKTSCAFVTSQPAAFRSCIDQLSTGARSHITPRPVLVRMGGPAPQCVAVSPGSTQDRCIRPTV